MNIQLQKSLLITSAIILNSIISSAQWVNLFSGSPNLIISDITQTPSGSLFAVGTRVNGTTYTPLIFKSINDGASWDTIVVPPSGYFFQTIAFLNNNIGYIGAGGGAYILQTTDGGNNWNYYYQDPSGTSINDIEVIDSANALACGFGPNMYMSGAAYKLTNQNVWDTINQSFPTITLDDLQMLNLDTGYVLSLYNKKLFKTNDGGNSWLSVYDFPSVVESMYWWNSNNGIAVGFNASYYRTIDGGNHWTKDSIIGFNNELTGVAFFDANNGYICSAGGNTFQSNDGGVYWTPLPTVVTTDLYNLEIHGGNAYAVGDGGVILRTAAPAGVSEVKNNIVINVYPNPADELVQINSSDNIQSIIITDAVGKIVYRGQNIKGKIFFLETKLFSDGIYFLQIRNKQNMAAQKLIIQH